MNNKIKIQIWDRDFELNAVFQNFPGEEVTKVQENTISSITNSNIAESLNAVKEYLKKYNAEDLDDDEISNIFRFVMPKSIIIPRTKDGKKFLLLCVITNSIWSMGLLSFLKMKSTSLWDHRILSFNLSPRHCRTGDCFYE